MSRTRRLFPPCFALATAILIANYALPAAAAVQAKFTELPADCSEYASIPLPAEAETAPGPKTPPACASYRSYRGIGRPVNYSEARACAWQERLAQKADLGQNQKEPRAWVVGGSLILADIYFNGTGVKRNLPLAMRLACESEVGMAMLALEDIKKLDDSPHARGPFEFCDYAASTITMSFCSGYASDVEEVRRTRYYDSLKASMTPEERTASDKLLTTKSAYIKAHASEVYQGGTIRTIRTIGSKNILEDLFRTHIVHFERKKWPALSDHQITTADVLLRHEYEKTLQQLRTQSEEGIDKEAVTAGQLSSVQGTWETYRDAWVEFAGLRYPAAVPAIRAQIVLDRYRLLKTIR
jgi:hypothetical protein